MITVLIGGSILLIVASGIALVFGFSGTDDTLLWTSMGASAGAALFLAIAYWQSKRQTRAARSGGRREVVGADEAPALQAVGADDESAPSVADERAAEDKREEAAEETPVEVSAAGSATAELPVPDVDRAQEKPAAAAASGRRSTRKAATRPAKKATRKATAKPTAGGEGTAAPAKKAASAKATANQVVAVPTTKKFHKPECRYASAAGGERLTKTTARRRGYSACGVCKP